MMQEGEEELSIDELASNLSTYKHQLQQVKKLLASDPGNSEYEDMEKELSEVASSLFLFSFILSAYCNHAFSILVFLPPFLPSIPFLSIVF
ncbi:hypothetical protein SLEP1_g53682 [Rubroshorea leprosula]|uniref:Survival of motor neuron-related-splicing factor 30 n=1 Tax=Rubroshorea leprosula TaxID=152421 RepID=A0AAV5MA09_9ROSI|nr:hypothetical protein SLEP1_g53682 [Rubroshorea leprosula]